MGHSAAKRQARLRLNSISGVSSCTSSGRPAQTSPLRQRRPTFKTSCAKRSDVAEAPVKARAVSSAFPFRVACEPYRFRRF